MIASAPSTCCLRPSETPGLHRFEQFLPTQHGYTCINKPSEKHSLKYSQLDTTVASFSQSVEFPPDLRLVLCLEGQTHLNISGCDIRLHGSGKTGVLLPINETVGGRKIFYRGRQRELVLFFNRTYLDKWLDGCHSVLQYLKHLQPVYFQTIPLVLQLAAALRQNCALEGEWRQCYLETLSKALLAEVLQQLLPPLRSDMQDLRRRKRLDRLAELLRSGAAVHMSLPQLASACYSNPTTLQADFKQQYGTSIARYLRSLKLERSRLLLAEGGSLVEAAMAAGYRNPECFSKAFKRHFGHPPLKAV